jgi:hypothetical protein
LSSDVSEVRAAYIIREMMMEAACTSETSVENYFARQYIPEDKFELLVSDSLRGSNSNISEAKHAGAGFT